MFSKILIIIILMSLFSVAYAQEFVMEITEEDGSPATYPYQTRFINGSVTDNGDGTTSVAAGGVAVITNCDTTDNFCFQYTSGQQLVLWVNGSIQMKWPQTAAVQDKLLLEASFGTGTDKILIEGSATDVLLLE